MKLFDMLTDVDIKRIKDGAELEKRIEELDNSLSIALDLNEKHQREIETLKAELAREKENHQYDNIVHDQELRKVLNK